MGESSLPLSEFLRTFNLLLRPYATREDFEKFSRLVEMKIDRSFIQRLVNNDEEAWGTFLFMIHREFASKGPAEKQIYTEFVTISPFGHRLYPKDGSAGALLHIDERERTIKVT